MQKSFNPVFVTSITGEDYSLFLLPHIYSIFKQHPNSKQVIYYSDISVDKYLQFPNCQFIRLNFNKKDGSKHAMINFKTLCFERAATDFADSPLALLDVDSLVIRPIDDFFQANIVFTLRDDGQYRLNSGVVLLDGQNSLFFTSTWKNQTWQIYQHQQDKARRLFGGADQMALYQLVGDYAGKTVKQIQDRELSVWGVSCHFLNEVNCQFNENTHIFHYKTGWHPILRNNQKLTGNRVQCQKAYDYWLKIQEDLMVYQEGIVSEVTLKSKLF